MITLIHGTYARDATWVQPGSTLYNYLQQNLLDPVELRSFEWSGRNDHGARLEASSALKSQLDRQVKEFPDALHYIIAHSHGGNIALHAVDEPLQDVINAVICLNTPFINVVRRNIGNFSKMLWTLALLFAMGATSWLLVLAMAYSNADLPLPALGLEEMRPWWHIPMALLVVVSVLIVAPIGLAGLFIGSFLAMTTKKARARREDLLSRLKLPNMKSAHIICINNADDEIDLVFTILSAITHLPYIMLHYVVLRVLLLFVVLAPIIATSSALIYGPFGDINQIGMLRHMEHGALRDTLFAIYFGLFVLFFAAVAPLVYVLFCAFIAQAVNLVTSHVPLGMVSTVANSGADFFLIRLSVANVPATNCHLEFYDVERSGKFLSHSVAYQDVETLGLVVRRIRELSDSGLVAGTV